MRHLWPSFETLVVAEGDDKLLRMRAVSVAGSWKTETSW
jgi:hypothetical protein